MKTETAKDEAQVLSRLSAIGAAIAAGQAPQVVFNSIVEAVQALGFDCVRLDLVSADGSSISTAASYGFDSDPAGKPVPVSEDPDLTWFFANPNPQLTKPGRDGDSTGERGSVPIVLRGRIIGKLTVDNASSGRLISRAELDTVEFFANQAAIAQTMLWARSLETLQETTLAITSMRDRHALLSTIIEQAVKLLGAKSGGLYEYRPELGELTVIADYSRPEHIGKTLRVGEGMAGRIIQDRLPHMVVADYSNWQGRAAIYGGERLFGAVLGVPIRWEERYIGVLYVDDEVGRSFSDTDIRLLQLFANQAAIFLISSNLLVNDEKKLRRLERFAQATQEMMSNLDAMLLQDRLMLIAKYAVEILQAESSGVFRINDGELVLEASYGQREEFAPGKVRLRIHDDPGGGLTGYIAYHGQLFRAHGQDLINHPAVAAAVPHTPSGCCYSLLAIPLKKRVGNEEALIGLLRVDNKKGEDGFALATLGFTQEDEWILTTFAEAAVVAIESAELVDRLKEQKDFQERLIASSPDGIIAVDRKGRVTEFNKRAEEILGYTRQEVLGTPVSPFYVDAKEPHLIGKLLTAANDSPVRNYETVVRSKKGERIPIRHASTFLFDSKGERMGSVGYFEDLREQRALESRESLLLRASNVLAEADVLDDGLQRLAEMMVSQLGRSFCDILLMDEEGESLTLRAEFLRGDPDWKSKGQKIIPAQWEGLTELLGSGRSSVLQWSDPHARPILRKLTALLGFQQEIQALLVIPLKVGDQVVGQLDLGDFQGDSHSGFPAEEVDLVSAIAAQTTVLIHKFQLLETKARLLEQARGDAEKLLSFYEMSGELISLHNPREILDRIVQQTVMAAGASWSSILLIDEKYRFLNPIISNPSFSLDPRDPIAVRSNGISIQVMQTGKAFPIENIKKMRARVNPMLIKNFVKAAICLPFSLPGKRIGVMWIHYDTPRRFPESEVAALQLYVNQAAIAYDRARQMERLEDLRVISTALAEANDTKSVVLRIVDGARRVLKADDAVLWLYDPQADDFIPESSGYSGDHPLAWSKFQMHGVPKRGTAFRIMAEDWLSVEDGEDPDQSGGVGPSTSRFLKEIDGRGFQGVALKVGREKLGVLYAIYAKACRFDDEEQETALTFAGRAALALKKAKLLDQVKRARQAAEVVARVTLLEDQRSTLMSIAREVREALDCGAVVLFRFDQETGELGLPPAIVGVHPPIDEEILDLPLVLAMVERDGAYIVPDAARDERFKDSPFAFAQGIKSCVALPLRAAGRKVGVMLVNYRNPRRFTADELTNMELFANQAAVAIRNAQLFDEAATKLAQQEALAGLSRELLIAPSVQETMNRAVEFAARVLDTEFCNIVLPDREGRLILSAAVGWEQQMVGNFVLEHGEGSQTGYTIQKRKPVAVYDYRKAKEFRAPEVVAEHGIRSGLSAPMFREGRIVGAMLVHTTRARRFTEDDEILLSLIANQTAIALERAQQYEASQRKSASLLALYEASKAISAGFQTDSRQILEKIVQPAMERIFGTRDPKAVLGTIQLYDEERDELVLESVYPPEKYSDLVMRIGERQPLQTLNRRGRRLGITGRTLITGKPQLLKDVRKDSDYVEYAPGTLSEMAVPLLDRGKVIGILNAESDHVNAFDEEDLETLQTFAELVVVAIQNAQQVEELREARQLVSARTTLAWMGIGNAVGRHEMARSVGNLLNEIHLLAKELEKTGAPRETIEHVQSIKRRVLHDFNVDRSPAGRVDKELSSIAVNEVLIRRCKRRIGKDRSGKGGRLEVICELSDSARIRGNAQWLDRVLDILINNALEATKTVEQRHIVLGSRLRNSHVEIFVSDNGIGIPEHVRGRLLREPIQKPEGARGLGVGLLIAQAIIQIYGGNIRWEDKKPSGTEVVISLPLENSVTPKESRKVEPERSR